MFFLFTSSHIPHTCKINSIFFIYTYRSIKLLRNEKTKAEKSWEYFRIGPKSRTRSSSARAINNTLRAICRRSSAKKHRHGPPKRTAVTIFVRSSVGYDPLAAINASRGREGHTGSLMYASRDEFYNGGIMLYVSSAHSCSFTSV